MKPELKNYRVTTIEGEETFYNTHMYTEGVLFIFEVYSEQYKGRLIKMISIPFNSVMKVETVNHPNESDEEGAIVIPHSQFRQFSQSMEIWDNFLNDSEKDDYDPAS